MALREIRKYDDPALYKVCRPVEKFDEKLAQLLDDMAETMYDANGVGLAAPQVGVLRRVVVIDGLKEFTHELKGIKGRASVFGSCRSMGGKALEGVLGLYAAVAGAAVHIVEV